MLFQVSATSFPLPVMEGLPVSPKQLSSDFFPPLFEISLFLVSPTLSVVFQDKVTV